MAEPTNPSGGISRLGHASQSEQQETMLLGDVPEASELMPEVSRQASTGSPSNGTNTPHLSSAALAALSQRYDILGEAGHGSMGNVYKARDRETGEIVALKLLKPEIASDQAMMDRFKNELLFARKITHKNVCRVHEFNRIGGIAYTSMEFVEGESLRSALTRFGGLPQRKAIDLALQICSGLKEAHAQGIVHRDLKPENIMIDGQGNVKIMDFGIARSMEAVTRMTGSMVGTPAYMAPEQVGGKPVDYRTDVYSLGLILYEMFTGTQAFRADNAVAVALKQMRESPVPPHEIDPQIPVPIERAILKCIEKEPAKRFQTISELEGAIRGQATVVTAPLASVVPAAVSPTTSGRGTQRPIFDQLPATRPARKRVPPAVWGALAAVLVLALLAGARAARIQREAAALPPPVPSPAPRPPDFAFVVPARAPVAQSTAPPAQPRPAKPAAAKPAEGASEADTAKAKPAQTIPAPAASAPAFARSRGQLAGQALPLRDLQQRSERILGEKGTGAAPANSQKSSYIWVGRFERQDRARAATKKIDGLGVKTSVATRWGNKGQFFVVWIGPCPAKTVPDVLDWLHAQGFAEAREFKNPLAGFPGNRNRGQNQNQGPDADQTPNP
ncbi:MAG TPA: serine/threonine-protein kinase [Candidatus Baltobacteraceae bacterium]|nr:serine/threonine-protein kinase [Candidatus Baltobacteraceae bacterium]